MKKYKLLQWYPSLKKTVEVGCVIAKIFSCGGYHYRGTDNEGVVFYVSARQCENNPDFWKLIEDKKPLYLTYDGVELYNERDYIYVVSPNYNHIKTKFRLHELSVNCINEIYKVFAHESNADEYIWRNKRVFSYEDFIKWGNAPYQRVIEQLAKERI